MDHEVDSLREIEEIASALSADAAASKPHQHAYVSPILFRGHARASWKLQTTLERHGLINLRLGEYVRYLSRVKPAIESVLNRNFEFNWDNSEEKSTSLPESQPIGGIYPQCYPHIPGCHGTSGTALAQKNPLLGGFRGALGYLRDGLKLSYGAGCGNRTHDLLITNQLLYQLS